MGPFDMLNISASALTAERQRAEVTTANMANAETTHTAEGGPYRRKEVVFASQDRASFRMMFASTQPSLGRVPGTVRVAQVVDDSTPMVKRFEPGHPDADKDGYVSFPAINPVQEMVDLMGATRAYQLNASAVSAAKQMIQQSIDILKS
jgi:flagellar basal-body rod protein FlgC